MGQACAVQTASCCLTVLVHSSLFKPRPHLSAPLCLQGSVLRYRKKDESAASQAAQEQSKIAMKLQEASPQGSHQGSHQSGHLVYGSPGRPEMRASPGDAQDLADVPSTPFQTAPVRLPALGPFCSKLGSRRGSWFVAGLAQGCLHGICTAGVMHPHQCCSLWAGQPVPS